MGLLENTLDKFHTFIYSSDVQSLRAKYKLELLPCNWKFE